MADKLKVLGDFQLVPVVKQGQACVVHGVRCQKVLSAGRGQQGVLSGKLQTSHRALQRSDQSRSFESCALQQPLCMPRKST